MKTNQTEQREFSAISKFLENFGSEVEGHAAARLSPEQETALSRLASGNIGDLGRAELESLLGTNRNAVAFLAEQFRARRHSGLQHHKPE
jgi:hypothetical protein